MRSYARHQLKQDSFTTSTAETISWAVERRSQLVVVGIVVVVILAILGGGWAWINYRDQQAGADLSSAIDEFGAPIRPAGAPATPDMVSFASAQERAKTSNADFNHIASKYFWTQSSQVARYFAGVTAREMGDNATAEKDLEQVSGSRYKEIASLAKMALAGIYHDTGRNLQAIDLYKQLIERPTVSVGKSAAQLGLASVYESMSQPDEARHIYEQMAKDSPGTGVSQIATQRLQTLSKQQ